MTPLTTAPAGQVKAIAGGVLAGLLALGTALTDGGLTLAEGIGAAATALGTWLGVYAMPRNSE